MEIVNFYKFIDLDELDELRELHLAECLRLGLRGKILLANEGINAALAGPRDVLEAYMDFLRRDLRFTDVDAKYSAGMTTPFKRMLVKIKPAVVTFSRTNDPSPAEIQKAPRLNSAEWKTLIEAKQEDVVLVDTRNDYEVDWGTFEGAEHLDIAKFSDFPEKFVERYQDQKDKTFLIFCTGGIRCEKAAPWIMNQGFKNVLQLDGGILKYFEEQGQAGYDGSCFVFDQRWVVGSDLAETSDGPGAPVIQPKPGSYAEERIRKAD
jgi:UPF0176 protein